MFFYARCVKLGGFEWGGRGGGGGEVGLGPTLIDYSL
jgi:hypothetical protein